MSESGFLNETAVQVRRREDGRAEVVISSEPVCVQFRRLFPISRPARYVAMLDASGGGLGILRDPEKLDRESRKVVEAELDHHYFVPKVLRIESVTAKHGKSLWRVQTDRGSREFEVRDRREQVRAMDRRVLIVDTMDCRYEIEDIEALDSGSQRLLRRAL